MKKDVWFYELKVKEAVEQFDDHSIFVENELLKIGCSAAEIEWDDEGLYVESEDETVLKTGHYDSFEQMLEMNDQRFVITRDCAYDKKFVTWEDFIMAVDGEKEIHILTL